MIKHILTTQINPRDLRLFLGIWAGIFSAIFIYGLFREKLILWAFIALVIVLALQISPRVITPLYRAWIVLGEIIGFVVSRAILFLIFFGIFSPIGLFFRLIKRDILRQKFDKNAKSYFITRQTQPTSMANQF